MKGLIVVGLAWGDEGKGLTTSYLCTQTPNPKKIVIRFSGGQQAGHTVIHNDIKHIHSNFGSGTLNGVPSYFSEHCTIYPVTIANETKVLNNKGIFPELYVHPLAKVTTCYDVMYNKIMERKRGHGSCGLGIGATMKRNIETGYKLNAIDLSIPKLRNEKLKGIYDYYCSILSGDDLNVFKNEGYQEEVKFFGSLKSLEIRNYDFLRGFDDLIFEGSQGILLDMDHGIFPNVTYANTTSKNAIEICKKLSITDINIYYITRCYQTRHGNGWMSNTESIDLINTEEEINVYNEWQTNFRIGEIDYELLKYSLDVDSIYTDGINYNTNLVVTCLDQIPDFEFKYELLDRQFDEIYNSYSPISRMMEKLYFVY